MIRDVTRHTVETKQLEREIPDLNVSVKFSATSPLDLEELTLTKEESQVIGYIDSDATIEKIAKACNLTPIAIRRIMSRLSTMGAIEIIQPEGIDRANVAGQVGQQVEGDGRSGRDGSRGRLRKNV